MSEEVKDVQQMVGEKKPHIGHCQHTHVHTFKSRFNESRFHVKSLFKGQNFATEMEFHIKNSRFSVKSRFKESECADGGHSLNRDFTVLKVSGNVHKVSVPVFVHIGTLRERKHINFNLVCENTGY